MRDAARGGGRAAALLGPGPAVPGARGDARARRAARSTGRRSSCGCAREPVELVDGPADRDHESGRASLALRPRGLAFPQPVAVREPGERRRAVAELAPSRRAAPSSRRCSDRCRAGASGRAGRRSRATRTGTAAAGTSVATSASVRYGSAFSMNALKISAGYVPPATGAAVVLGQHRPQLVGVADPDGGHEVGRVADEPRVAVVLRRAGLAGDGDSRGSAPPCRCRR